MKHAVFFRSSVSNIQGRTGFVVEMSQVNGDSAGGLPDRKGHLGHIIVYD